MALSWTQDRLGPLCRYAEDCAVVMSVIAKPDGRDLSVSEIPFNWNAHLDIRKLRVGYLKDAFDETRDPAAKKLDDARRLEQVQALGVKLVPVTMPDWTLDVSSYRRGIGGVLRRTDPHGARQADDQSRPRATGFRRSARLIPAVEYLQSQRARSHDDDEAGGGDGGRGRVPGPGIGGGPPAGAAGGRRAVAETAAGRIRGARA